MPLSPSGGLYKVHVDVAFPLDDLLAGLDDLQGREVDLDATEKRLENEVEAAVWAILPGTILISSSSGNKHIKVSGDAPDEWKANLSKQIENQVTQVYTRLPAIVVYKTSYASEGDRVSLDKEC